MILLPRITPGAPSPVRESGLIARGLVGLGEVHGGVLGFEKAEAALLFPLGLGFLAAV